MKLPRWLLSLAFASSCSLVFEPSKVPVKSIECPAPPTAPASLEALAGEAAGTVRWRWPQVDGTEEARLCTTLPGGAENCQLVPVEAACTAGHCDFVQVGLTDGLRVSGRVIVSAACDQTASSPTTSISAFDASNADDWVLAQSSCASATPGFSSAGLSLEQQGLACQTSLTLPDEGFSAFTLDADLKVSATADGIAAGFVFAQSAAGYRLKATTVVPNGRLQSALLEQTSNGTGATVASGTHTVSSSEWTHVRLVVDGPTFSWQQGPVDGPLVERLRWVDTSARKGRLGIAGSGTGRFEVRALRVSSRAQALPKAPSSAHYFFGEDGGLPWARTVGIPVASLECPSWASACDAGCAPPSNARCGLFTRTTNYFDYALVALPQPTGLDVTRPTVVNLRFALPADAGLTNTRVLDSQPFPLLDSSPNELKSALLVLGDAGLSTQTWHLASWRFDPDAGIECSLDGVVRRSGVWPGASGNQHLGSFLLGNTFNASDLVVHELSIEQP